jgi:hypothetical protein
MQKCKVCGYVGRVLTLNHLKEHGYTSKQEYLKDYPDGLKQFTMPFTKSIYNNIIDPYNFNKITKILHRRKQIA